MASETTDRIAAALTFDPLAEAERKTGESYKESPETMRLGMGLAMMHNEHKESLLRQTADSYFNASFAEQMSAFTALGFTEVYRETFDGASADETYVILWAPNGLLATCETYGGDRRNTAKVYYNYRHASGGYPHQIASSGHLNGEVWVGDHDAREGIRHNLDAMRAQGEFLARWVERPFLWLLNYAEKSGDYEAINAAKISRLPEAVRLSITPTEEVAA